ncbi:MAG: DUF4388 domain-containing protein [Anaeromyxobacteraceae bacterium]
MALKGTLKDFGIAEILQLIGQQAKSGMLHLEGRDAEIHIAMADGNVVRAEHAGRETRERLGSRLVRAEILTQERLEYALDLQKRSLRRLGDILVELGFVSKQELKEMTALQTTETVYRLFHWKSGTYEFVPGDVEWDPESVTPLRAESVLMEGFRQVDEWPMVRRRISSTAMTFERARELEPDRSGGQARRQRTEEADVDAAFDAMGSEKPAESDGEFANLGQNERRLFQLTVPGRTVEKIIDLSRLGEFETCKGLLNLVNLGYLRPIAPTKRSAAVGTYASDWAARLRVAAVRVLATVVIAAAVAAIAYWVDRRGLAWGESAQGAEVGDNAAQRFIARYQLQRLSGALEVFRLENGEYPARLDALVEAELVTARDLSHPWQRPYYYRRTPEGRYVLLPPIE